MNKFMILLLIAILLYVAIPMKSIDPRAQPYYDRFMSQIHTRCRYYQYYHPGQIIVELKPLNVLLKQGDAIGDCNKRLNRINVIIDETFWNHATEVERYEIVAHELSHCVLFEDHAASANNYMSASFEPIEKTRLDDQISNVIGNICSD